MGHFYFLKLIYVWTHFQILSNISLPKHKTKSLSSVTQTLLKIIFVHVSWKLKDKDI